MRWATACTTAMPQRMWCSGRPQAGLPTPQGNLQRQALRPTLPQLHELLDQAVAAAGAWAAAHPGVDLGRLTRRIARGKVGKTVSRVSRTSHVTPSVGQCALHHGAAPVGPAPRLLGVVGG